MLDCIYQSQNKHRTKTCSAPNLNAAMIEEEVVKRLKSYLSTLDLEKYIQELRETAKKVKTPNKSARDELLLVENEIDRVRKAIRNAGTTDVVIALTSDLDNLFIRKNELSRSLGDLEPALEDGILSVKAKIEKDVRLLDDPDQLKRLVQDYVQKIYAYEDTVSIDIGVTMNGSSSRI